MSYKLKLVEELARVTTPREFQQYKKNLAEYSTDKLVEIINYYKNNAKGKNR